MKSNLNFTARADDKEGTATMGLLGNSLGAMMDLMHDAAVAIGQWADMPPAAILATIISVIAVEEDEVRKVVERLGGREEESGAAEDGPADLGPGQGAAHHTGEGAGEADQRGWEM